MTVNPLNDNTDYWAAWPNSWANALAGEYILSGCSISKGSGDWDIDVTSGKVRLGGSLVDISSGTVTLTDPANDADMDSGESRVDLVHVDSSDTLATTEGAAATNPSTPDLPADEVLLGFVVVANGDSTAADSDINDVPVLGFPADIPFFGDGNSGSITRSSNANENGVIRATDYTVQSGTTMTVTTGVLIVLAKNSIDISGTIDANAQGASGGSGGSATNSGSNGSNSVYVPQSSGGAGGTGNAGADGGDGGDGDTATPPKVDLLTGLINDSSDVQGSAGAGGGGGGGAEESAGSTENGANGSSPGGGGEGATSTTSGGGTDSAGGDGGDGGGIVILAAPDVSVSGTVTADGGDGGDGAADNQAGSGGGGGGSGGVVLIQASNLSVSGTLSAAAGSGGTGGTGNSSSGGDGADGAAGSTLQVTV